MPQQGEACSNGHAALARATNRNYAQTGESAAREVQPRARAESCSLNHSSSHLAAPRRVVRGLRQPACAVWGPSPGGLRVSACAESVAARERARGRPGLSCDLRPAPQTRWLARAPTHPPETRLQRRTAAVARRAGVDKLGGGARFFLSPQERRSPSRGAPLALANERRAAERRRGHAARSRAAANARSCCAHQPGSALTAKRQHACRRHSPPGHDTRTSTCALNTTSRRVTTAHQLRGRREGGRQA